MSVSIDLETLRKEAAQQVLNSGGDQPHYKKCWNCDPTQEKLQKYPFVIACFICGDIYFQGHNLEIGEGDAETTGIKPIVIRSLLPRAKT